MSAAELLPVGQRVTHFDGGPNTHGHGTIVAYNRREPNRYFAERPAEAAEMAHAALGQAGLNALVDSFYDGERCPYVVHWDPSERYPKGYKDVYERDSVRAITTAQEPA